MPLARIDEVVDGVVARIEAEWEPESPDGVTAEDVFDIVCDPTEPDVLIGRRVWVLPDTYDSPETATRAENVNDYGIVVLVAELYRGIEDRVPKEWARERRHWVQTVIYAPLTDVRGARLLAADDDPSAGLWPVNPSGVDPVYDAEELRSRKLFLSVVRVTFREHAGD